MTEELNVLPKVSVIVINDNQSSGLRDTLASLARQSHSEVEIIIADNGSNDDSLAVINENAEIITHWSSRKCESKYQLVDELIHFASGSYIFISNSGNVLCSNSVFWDLLKQSNNHDIIYGNIVRRYKDDKLDIVKLASEITVDGILYNMPDLLSVSLVKRELFTQSMFYDNRLKYTVESAFLVKLFFVKCINYIHVDVNVSSILVGRHGGVDKLSNIQLAFKEKQWFIENSLPKLTSDLILNKIKSESLENKYLDSGLIRLALLLQSKKTVLNNKIKYIARSVRNKVELFFYRKKNKNLCFDIPIIINNRNHLTYLQRLINSLEKRGYKNIYILDNNSTYEPLLEFYQHTHYKVFMLGQNVGFCALWDTDVFDLFKDKYYVYTDSDLELVDECPDDFITVMHYLLNKYSLGKVGLSLLINDLPKYFMNRDEVIAWEKKFNSTEVDVLAYNAAVDTTFALYKPNAFGDSGMLPAFRTKFPCSARHLPWYENTSGLTEEQKYYYNNVKTSSHWSNKISSNN